MPFMTTDERNAFLKEMKAMGWGSDIAEKQNQELKKLVPKTAEIQKKKFLCSLKKAEPSPMEEEEEKIVEQCMELLKPDALASIGLRNNSPSKLWSDKIAYDNVRQILEKNANFEIGVYLDCVKAIYIMYSKNVVLDYRAIITYVLTHARSFGNPSQNMFKLKRNSDTADAIVVSKKEIAAPLPDTRYMSRITTLIEDLKASYDEVKYRILNANVTYLTLLILRRFVRNESQFSDAFTRMNTHDDYVKLCPHPLDTQLPRICAETNKWMLQKSLKLPSLLAIYAFLHVKDENSKRILRVTCIQHIEWTGLQLPYLFFKVASLYGMEEAELWDNLRMDKTIESLFHLANDYYKQYKMSKADPPETVAWFPYCRALDGNFHNTLSASPKNELICMIMAYLVDFKIGFDKSFVRNSHWARNNKMLSNDQSILKFAEAFYKKHNV